MRKTNEIFGYGYFVIGVIKIIILALGVIQFGTNVGNIVHGGEVENSSFYSLLSVMVGFVQIAFAIGSIIMIILNKKKQPGIILGYLMGIGAVLIEFIVPPFLLLFFVIAECGLYMRAGTLIVKKNKENYVYDDIFNSI